MTGNVYSVGQVNSYIRNMFAQDFMMSHIYVRGEVSNCRYHSSGHIYFTLKDHTGVLQAVMFAGFRKNGLKFRMKEGDNCIVLGSIRVYERDGKYQLYAEQILLEGAGLLYQKFEALKRELEEMGMFAPEYKQPVPRFASRIGVVTAPAGAAIRDIQNISHRRNPFVQVILYPAQVQGEGAARSVVNGIHALEERNVDVIIVGRGGGSMEDLWAFNEEIVARAIFDCPVPVISAVGHETDFTIADFVADLRAPTPSAAAELAVFDIRQVSDQIGGAELALNRCISGKLSRMEERVRAYENQFRLLNPRNRFLDHRQRAADSLDRLSDRMGQILRDYQEKLKDSRQNLQSLAEQNISEKRHRMELYAAALDGHSPLKKLQSGYAFVTDADGKRISSVSSVKSGDRVRAWLADGSFTAEVKDIRDRRSGTEIKKNAVSDGDEAARKKERQEWEWKK